MSALSKRLRAHGRACAVLALAAVVLLAVVHELTATPWRTLAQELGPVGEAFFLPLDTLSQGVQTGLETGPRGETILWGYGPESRLRYATYAPMRLRLCYSFETPIPGQAVTVTINGREAAFHDARGNGLPTDAGRPVCREFTSRAGENTLGFDYRLWNHGGSAFAADDPRNLAVSFTTLQLLPAPAPLVGGPPSP